jgi:hypothetical protein
MGSRLRTDREKGDTDGLETLHGWLAAGSVLFETSG